MPSPTGLSRETLSVITPEWDVVYVSCDVEADGPFPGIHSMLNLGAAALNLDNELLGSWSANLHPLEGAVTDPETMEFWGRNPEAWAAVTADPRDPVEAMADYVGWLDSLPARAVLVVYPTWDAMYHHWYTVRFAGRNPMGHAALCAKSFGAGVLGQPFTRTGKDHFPAEWFDPTLPHTHNGLDDAVAQGVMAINALRHRLGLPPRPLTRRDLTLFPGSGGPS